MAREFKEFSGRYKKRRVEPKVDLSKVKSERLNKDLKAQMKRFGVSRPEDLPKHIQDYNSATFATEAQKQFPNARIRSKATKELEKFRAPPKKKQKPPKKKDIPGEPKGMKFRRKKKSLLDQLGPRRDRSTKT